MTAYSGKGMAPVTCDTGTARAGEAKVGLCRRLASPGQSTVRDFSSVTQEQLQKPMLRTQGIYFHFPER